MSKPASIKVSVIMITYNHEPFLKQGIDSILNQETDFEYELIIGNDKSPDNSDEIVKEIIRTHPQGYRIKYFRNEVNLGIMPNSKKALDKIEGEYFALCEGDDYWIDTRKLQKQVDFLDANLDFSICFHNTRVEYFNDDLPAYFLNENIEKDVFTLDDLIGEDEVWFMATTSLMLRTAAYGSTPEWLTKSKSGDIPIIILTARNGKIKYLPEIMAAYRKHSGGSSLTDGYDDEVFLKNRIFMYSMLNRDTGFLFDKRFKKNIARYYLMLLGAKQYQEAYFKKLSASLKYITLTFPEVPEFKSVLRDHMVPQVFITAFRKVKGVLGLIPK